jgi:two-component sensor histidine kinase/CHASE3 domain sensor protein
MVAGFAVLILAAFFAYSQHERSVANAAHVHHTFEVKEKAAELFGMIQDAESGQRGFLITSDEHYLENYKTALARIPALLSDLKNLVANNPDQAAFVDKVEQNIEAKLDEIALTISLARDGKTNDMLAVVKSDEGRAIMDELRANLGAFTDAENRQLLLREAEYLSASANLRIALIGAIALASLLGIISSYLTNRQIDNIAAHQQKLLDLNRSLEERVRQRTAELDLERQVAEAQTRLAEREKERVELVLRDTNHRVGNNLALVSSLIGLQIGATASQEAKAALEAARNRVQAIATAQRRLRFGDDLKTTRMDELLSAIVQDLEEASPHGERVKLEGDFAAVSVNSRDAITLAIVVNELAVNALKHAFPAERTGKISISLARNGNNALVLTVADDGIGTTGAKLRRSAGLGSKIVDRLSQQFGAEIETRTGRNKGTVYVIRLPNLAAWPVAEPEPAS